MHAGPFTSVSEIAASCNYRREHALLLGFTVLCSLGLLGFTVLCFLGSPGIYCALFSGLSWDLMCCDLWDFWDLLRPKTSLKNLSFFACPGQIASEVRKNLEVKNQSFVISFMRSKPSL